MKTAVQIFLKQTRRSTKRLILQLVLLCAAVTFFTVSLNLYANSAQNLKVVENTYTTLAAISFYGDVNSKGDLVSPSDADYQGNHLLTLTPAQYDLTPLLDLDMVTGYDLRPRYLAYIPGHEAIAAVGEEELHEIDHTGDRQFGEDEAIFSSEFNLIRFVIEGSSPVEISLKAPPAGQIPNYTETEVAVRIVESARDTGLPSGLRFTFTPYIETAAQQYAEEIRAINQTEDIDKLILYPDTEYIASFFTWCTFTKDETTGGYQFRQNYSVVGPLCREDYTTLRPANNRYDRTATGLAYTSAGEEMTWDNAQGFYIQRWSTETAAYWEQVFQAANYTGQSFWTTLTNDIENIPAWYAGGMYLNEGRMISAEEYAAGAKVCMISARMAEMQGWRVGDTLDMNLYQYKNTAIYPDQLPEAEYTRDAGGFFGQDTYTIVGILGQQEITDTEGNAPETYYQPWNTIYIPINSVQNKPEESTWLIQPSTLTLKLKNGSIPALKKAVEELSLTEQKTGQYQLKFSYFDQGYNKIKPGLDEMNRNAKILLSLSVVLLVVTMTLLAFLFSRQHKHSAGILRMLGGSKKQAFTAILTCAAVVVAAGGAIGAILGGGLTAIVGASTLGDAAESAKVALSTGASPVLTVLSGLGCVALFLALTAIFTTTYIGKEPRALLPQDKG